MDLFQKPCWEVADLIVGALKGYRAALLVIERNEGLAVPEEGYSEALQKAREHKQVLFVLAYQIAYWWGVKKGLGGAPAGDRGDQKKKKSEGTDDGAREIGAQVSMRLWIVFERDLDRWSKASPRLIYGTVMNLCRKAYDDVMKQRRCVDPLLAEKYPDLSGRPDKRFPLESKLIEILQVVLKLELNPRAPRLARVVSAAVRDRMAGFCPELGPVSSPDEARRILRQIPVKVMEDRVHCVPFGHGELGQIVVNHLGITKQAWRQAKSRLGKLGIEMSILESRPYRRRGGRRRVGALSDGRSSGRERAVSRKPRNTAAEPEEADGRRDLAGSAGRPATDLSVGGRGQAAVADARVETGRGLKLSGGHAEERDLERGRALPTGPTGSPAASSQSAGAETASRTSHAATVDPCGGDRADEGEDNP